MAGKRKRKGGRGWSNNLKALNEANVGQYPISPMCQAAKQRRHYTLITFQKSGDASRMKGNGQCIGKPYCLPFFSIHLRSDQAEHTKRRAMGNRQAASSLLSLLTHAAHTLPFSAAIPSAPACTLPPLHPYCLPRTTALPFLPFLHNTKCPRPCPAPGD